MFRFLTNAAILLKQYPINPKPLPKHLFLVRFLCSHPVSSYPYPSTTSREKVGIFWDLENKPPNSLPPYEAASRLKKAVSCFGVIKYMVAYANPHAFSYVPPKVREQRNVRKALDGLENKGLIKPKELYRCKVCGRRFHANERLMNHFKVHERENQKRLNQIDSAKGRKRLDMVGKYAAKMDKYKIAEREILTPKVGYGLADELKRAGFWVQPVAHRPQAADSALRAHMVDAMDHRRVEYLVLVSDDSDFAGVLNEARERCFKTVVVGDRNDGVLKRNANVWFSWKDILVGKARKEGPEVVGRLRDRDLLRRLEWTYKPEIEKNSYGSNDECNDGGAREDTCMMDDDDNNDFMRCKDYLPWWKVDSDSEVKPSESSIRIS